MIHNTFSNQDKGKRTRLEDGYRTLENKKFQDYTDEDMRKLGTIDVALELYTTNYEQGSQMALLEMADKINNHEVAIIDNCLCMRRIAPLLPGMIHNKKVLTTRPLPTCGPDTSKLLPSIAWTTKIHSKQPTAPGTGAWSATMRSD